MRLQDYGGFQDKQNYACLVARVALEKYASGREISNQQSCKQSLATTQSWIAFGTLLVFCYNFSVSCLCATHSKQSRTSWNNDILLLFQTCHCRIAGQIIDTAWKNNFGNLSLQLDLWRLCHWQDYRYYQDKQNNCMVAGIELEKKAIAHEMSNQGNTTWHKAEDFLRDRSLPTTLQLLCFTLHNL